MFFWWLLLISISFEIISEVLLLTDVVIVVFYENRTTQCHHKLISLIWLTATKTTVCPALPLLLHLCDLSMTPFCIWAQRLILHRPRYCHYRHPKTRLLNSNWCFMALVAANWFGWLPKSVLKYLSLYSNRFKTNSKLFHFFTLLLWYLTSKLVLVTSLLATNECSFSCSLVLRNIQYMFSINIPCYIYITY